MYAIGVAGSHRTGKSTLCQVFSEVTGIPLIETSASQTFKRLGVDPQAHYDLNVRLSIQAEILSDLESKYKEAPPVFVTDRTPLDAAAYMLSEYNRSNLTEVSDHLIINYLDRCYSISQRHFRGYLILQPGIPIKHDPTKAPGLPGYMEHINSLVIGMAMSTYLEHADISIVERNELLMKERLLKLANLSGKMFTYMEENSGSSQRAPC